MITTIYEQLIAEITDEDERKVFDALLDADGRRVTREELVQEVYGVHVDSNVLAASAEDRMVREIIRRLRERDYPIVSSSGKAGYTMKASAEEMDIYIAEQASRKDKIQGNIDHAYRSKDKARLVKECRDAMRYVEARSLPVQLRLIPVEVDS